MKIPRRQLKRTFRRHMVQRHQPQTFWSRFWLRRMSTETLAWTHHWEHSMLQRWVTHAESDLSDQVDGR